MIEATFKKLIEQYGVDSDSIDKMWVEIESNYSESNRYYHNLGHLKDILVKLNTVKEEIENWNVILFTLVYHDVIYKSSKSNNEEQSAKLAEARMREIGVSEEDIKLCYDQILATKSHLESANSDTNYFTDADLSILGRESNEYKDYCSKIRKEYSIYPNFIYKRGRKKVVQHFLSMNRIFKTENFYERFEEQAKQNLQAELNSL